MSLGNICFLKHKRFKCTGALQLATLQRPSVVVGWAKAREAEVEMYVFYIQWSKVVQHANTSNEGKQRPKYLQNYDEKLNSGKDPLILVITI